jgi:hypothetical protein
MWRVTSRIGLPGAQICLTFQIYRFVRHGTAKQSTNELVRRLQADK